MTRNDSSWPSTGRRLAIWLALGATPIAAAAAAEGGDAVVLTAAGVAGVPILVLATIRILTLTPYLEVVEQRSAHGSTRVWSAGFANPSPKPSAPDVSDGTTS